MSDLRSSSWRTTMQSKPSTLLLPDPSASILQHSQSLPRYCLLGHWHYAAVPGYGFATIDMREPQCPTASIGDDCAVSVSQLSSGPIIPAPFSVPNSIVVSHLNGKPDSGQVALSSGYTSAENGTSSIVSFLDNKAYGYSDTQNRLPPNYIEHHSSGYPRETGNISTLGNLGYGSAGPTMGLSSTPPFYEGPSGQVIDSYLYTRPTPSQSNSASYSTAQSSFCHAFPMSNQIPTSQSPHEDLGCSFPISLHHTRHADLPGFHGFGAGNKRELHVPGTVDNRTAAMTSGVVDDYAQFDGSKCNSEQVVYSDSEVSWSPLIPVIPAPREPHLSDYSDGGNTEISTDPSILCSLAAMNTTVGHTFHGSATGMTPGYVDDSGRMEAFSDQSIGSDLRSSSLSDTALLPHKLHALGRLPHAGGGNLALPITGPLAVEHPNKDVILPDDRTMACGWIMENGMACDARIGYHCEEHFSVVHGIKNMPSHFKVKCRWCPPSVEKELARKCFMRHIREVHMKRPRQKGGSCAMEKRKIKMKLHKYWGLSSGIVLQPNTCLVG
ncbi:hypothetical protein EDC04DRAFT_2805027 [Pisolithus marmoratus]|nr:hypothetical protein EDC04DRAFT_2805027 [Pisolithus marmoratus]